MNKIDIKHIEELLEELEALYEADVDNVIPEYLLDMVANIRQIIQEENKNNK